MAEVTSRGPVGQVMLKGAPEAVGAALTAVTGLAWPALRRAEWAGARGVLWMAPDEVLVLCEAAEAPELAAGLTQALAGVHHLALDVSDARAVLRVQGPGAADVLAKGVPVDLSDAAFPIGALRRTHHGQIAVALWRVAADTYDIVCFRSVATHLLAALGVAARPGAEVGFHR